MLKLKKTYLENCFIIIGYLFISGGLSKLPIPSILVTLIRYSIPAISLFLIAGNLSLFVHKAKRNIYLIAVIIMTFASFLWSISPSYSLATIRGDFLPMTIFGLYLATFFDIRTLLRKLAYAVALGLLLSWFTAIFMPSIGIAQGGKFVGSWVGIYAISKNTSSSYMVLSTLVLLCASFQQSRAKWLGLYHHVWFRCLGLSAIAFTFLTTSATGLGLTVLVAGVVAFYVRFKWRGKQTVLFLQIVTLIVVPLSVSWPAIAVAMGRDPTLTGRTIFWEIVNRTLMEERPILGFGRAGFWDSPFTGRIREAFGGEYLPPHTHNGFIEVALDIGLIGLGFFVISLLITWMRSLQWGYNSRNSLADLFPLAFLVFYTGNNITESYTLYLSHFFWPLYIAVALNTYSSHANEKEIDASHHPSLS